MFQHSTLLALRLCLPALVAFTSLNLCAQQKQNEIRFHFTVDNAVLELEKSYYLPAIKDSIRLEKIALYLSHLRLYKGNKLVGSAEKEFVLLNAENATSQQIPLPKGMVKKFDEVRFYFGIDSTTQVEGVSGGDLDPVHGMYWTWQSGYIHAKIEGVSPTCPARKNRFLFHIGGYQAPNSTVKEIRVKVPKSQSAEISIAIDQLLSQVDLRTNYVVMSPGPKAVTIALLLPAIFSPAP